VTPMQQVTRRWQNISPCSLAPTRKHQGNNFPNASIKCCVCGRNNGVVLWEKHKSDKRAAKQGAQESDRGRQRAQCRTQKQHVLDMAPSTPHKGKSTSPLLNPRHHQRLALSRQRAGRHGKSSQS
ncbi:MAG: hypothetical protein ACPIOQ_33795, partial [Promethearchaeia archaeon]